MMRTQEERTLYATASALMRHLNAADSCPLCRGTDDHDDDAWCAELERALQAAERSDPIESATIKLVEDLLAVEPLPELETANLRAARAALRALLGIIASTRVGRDQPVGAGPAGSPSTKTAVANAEPAPIPQAEEG